MTNYRLIDEFNGGAVAEGTISECMHAYLTDDGETYSVQPRMETQYNDDGEPVGKVQESTSGGQLVWTMFVGCRGQSQRETKRTCFGATEDEALSDLLDSLYREGVYTDRGRWSVEKVDHD
jgi:hypothetical protein